jgi:hypothetical protein
MHRDLRIRQEQIAKLFCNERPGTGSVNESLSLLIRSNDTAIQSINRCLRREDRAPEKIAARFVLTHKSMGSGQSPQW